MGGRIRTYRDLAEQDWLLRRFGRPMVTSSPTPVITSIPIQTPPERRRAHAVRVQQVDTVGPSLAVGCLAMLGVFVGFLVWTGWQLLQLAVQLLTQWRPWHP